ncbi:MAG: glutamine--tRNA ligase, partial [Chitinophagales bacterium]
NNPENPDMGSREIPFSRVIYIEQDDFMEDPPKKYFRLSPGQEVRLKHAYIIKCENVVKDSSGNVVELHCSYDPETKSGGANSGRKVKGTLHWVSADHAVKAEVRLYDYLFTTSDDSAEEGSVLNPQSIEILSGCMLEPDMAGVSSGSRFQFLRQGYFCVDPDTTSDNLVINRIVPLRDSWAKAQK